MSQDKFISEFYYVTKITDVLFATPKVIQKLN